MTRNQKIERMSNDAKRVVLCNGKTFVLNKRTGVERVFNSVNEAHRYYYGY